MIDDDDTITIDTRDRSWMPLGACRGLPYGYMFPDLGVHATEQKAICATCPVIDPCREYGMDEKYGVWGGLTESERRLVRRGLPLIERRGEFTHGTLAGYATHRRRKERPCDECRAAYNDYERQRVAARAGAA